MPTELFDLSENPFVEGHDARFDYPSRAHEEVVARLRDAIDGGAPIALVTGLPGAGKSTAVRAVLDRGKTAVVVSVQASPTLKQGPFRERILAGFAAEALDPTAPARPAEGIEARLRAVRASGRRAFLVVDEAQELGLPLLEDLRVLSNLAADGSGLLQIILVGQPGLEEALSRPGCGALQPRIAARCRLGTLCAEETEDYIRRCVAIAGGDSASVFTSEGCQTVHRLAHGIPREVNLLASEALTLAATAGESAVSASHVSTAALLLGFRSVIKDSRPAEHAEQPVAVEPADVALAAETGPGEDVAPDAGLAIMRDVSLPASSGEPITEPVEESPAARAESAGAPSASVPPASAGPPVGPASKATPTLLAGPEVDAWIARFRGPAGPPRIGSRLAMPASSADALKPHTSDAPESQPAPTVPTAQAGVDTDHAPDVAEEQPAIVAAAAGAPETHGTDVVEAQPACVAATAADGAPEIQAVEVVEQPVRSASPRHTGSRRGPQRQERSPRAGHAWRIVTTTVGALLLVATAGLVLVHSSRSLGPARPAARAAVANPIVKLESTRTAGMAEPRRSTIPVPRAVAASRPPAPVASASTPASTGPHRAPSPTVTEVRRRAAAPASPPAAAEPRQAAKPTSRLFGVEVATFMFESRAIAERDRLAALLSRPCRIVDSGEDGYAVVLGPLSSGEEAERLSADLSERGLVEQARVVRWSAADSTRR